MTNFYLTIKKQYWGRGKTLSESQYNARLEAGDEYYYYIIKAKAEDETKIFVDGMSEVNYPPDSVVFKSETEIFEEPAKWLE
tara:strand:- start:1542 stop:1787 length:246 start_codon:yes stop_codon:yes gene_type:complete